MHSLGIVQWNSTRRDHPGNPEGVSGSGPVIIYPISDSTWVSPTQVVPKKSGVTTVHNDKGV